MEVWSFPALEARCRRSVVDVWRHRPLEVRCRRVDVEEWRRAADVQTWEYEAWSAGSGRRRADMEVWSLSASVQTWKDRGLEV